MFKQTLKLVFTAILMAASLCLFAANGSTSLQMKISWEDEDGEFHRVTIDLAEYISEPTTQTLCDGFDESGKPCTLMVPDYSLWYNLNNWRSSLPAMTPYKNADGQYITIKPENLAAKWNNAFVEEAIKNSKANHKCVGAEDEEVEEEKHICEDWREGNCVCGYVFKDGHKCNTPLDHLPGLNINGCTTACGFDDCVRSIQITHTAMMPNDDFDHSCGCARSSTPLPGAIRWEHYRKVVEEKVENGKNVTVYRCEGGSDACGHTWRQEKLLEHTCLWQKSGDAEVCREDRWDASGNVYTCNETRPHSYEKEDGACHVNCLNVLSDGTVCGHTMHGGFWKYVDKKTHSCDCGDQTAGHVGQDMTEDVVALGDDGKEHVYTQHTIHCAEKPSGCGETITWLDNDQGVPPPDEEEEEEEEEDDDEEEEEEDCEAGHDIYQINGCDFCRRENCEMSIKGQNFKTDRTHHNLSPADSLDGSSWETEKYPPDFPDFKGHRCQCGTYSEKHNFGNEKEAGENRLVKVCKDCNFKVYYPDRRNCTHKNEDGLSYLLDDVCLNCSTNFEHETTIVAGDAKTKTCAYLQCKHLNGHADEVPEAKRGERCSYVEITSNGTHYGWSPKPGKEQEEHVCGCGAEVTNPHTLKEVYETDKDGNKLLCSKRQVCEECGYESEIVHAKVGWSKFVCDSRTVTIGKTICVCKYCDKLADRVITDNGTYEYINLREQTADDHYFWGATCVCVCGKFTKHQFPNQTMVYEEANYCGCYCGEIIAPHRQKDDDCECFGVNSQGVAHTPIIMNHLEPLNFEDSVSNQVCNICSSDIVTRKATYSCDRCGRVVRETEVIDPHTCGDKNVTSGTYHLTWDAYRRWNTEENKWENIEAGEEEGSCSAGGMSFMDAWAAKSDLSFDGGTIDIEQSGIYRLTATIDDSGSVSVGSLTASGGSRWDVPGTPVEGYLSKGKARVSGSASSNASLIQIHYTLEFVR